MLGARLWTGAPLGTGLGAIEYARGVPEHAVALTQARGRGLPPRLEPRVKQFLRRRTVIPDGDRRHGAVSRDIVG